MKGKQLCNHTVNTQPASWSKYQQMYFSVQGFPAPIPTAPTDIHTQILKIIMHEKFATIHTRSQYGSFISYLMTFYQLKMLKVVKKEVN
jgi:hypothetical protein